MKKCYFDPVFSNWVNCIFKQFYILKFIDSANCLLTIFLTKKNKFKRNINGEEDILEMFINELAKQVKAQDNQAGRIERISCSWNSFCRCTRLKGIR